jgi:hypothetical protein
MKLTLWQSFCHVEKKEKGSGLCGLLPKSIDSVTGSCYSGPSTEGCP